MYRAGLHFFRGLGKLPELAPATLAAAASVQAAAYPPKLGMPSAPVSSSAPHASGTQAISKHSQRVKCIADWKDLWSKWAHARPCT